MASHRVIRLLGPRHNDVRVAGRRPSVCWVFTLVVDELDALQFTPREREATCGLALFALSKGLFVSMAALRAFESLVHANRLRQSPLHVALKLRMYPGLLAHSHHPLPIVNASFNSQIRASIRKLDGPVHVKPSNHRELWNIVAMLWRRSGWCGGRRVTNGICPREYPNPNIGSELTAKVLRVFCVIRMMVSNEHVRDLLRSDRSFEERQILCMALACINHNYLVELAVVIANNIHDTRVIRYDTLPMELELSHRGRQPRDA